MSTKPWSEACERNQGPILEILQIAFADATHVLETGSGTGQHAAFFAAAMPHLFWQPTDLAENLSGIAAWRDAAGLSNLQPPLVLDVDAADWPVVGIDALFSANTLHIMSWTSVQNFFRGAGRVLPAGGVLAIYGPFNYDSQYTADSNARFDAFLRARDPLSGIRDVEAVHDLARSHGFFAVSDNAMAANNRLLAWRRGAVPEGCQ